MIEDFPEESDLAIRLKRARMRAWRRGMREMDLILGRYIDDHGSALTLSELTAFEGLLGRRDQDLYDWASGRKPEVVGDATDGERAVMAKISGYARAFAEN